MKLKSTEIPNHVLRLMDKGDRRGVLTYEEALINEKHRSEADFHKTCGQYIRLQGVKGVIHSRPDRKTTFDTPGVPDFIFVYENQAVGLELKMEKGVLSDSQRLMHETLGADGWVVCTAYSMKDVTNLFQLLREALKGKYHDPGF